MPEGNGSKTHWWAIVLVGLVAVTALVLAISDLLPTTSATLTTAKGFDRFSFHNVSPTHKADVTLELFADSGGGTLVLNFTFPNVSPEASRTQLFNLDESVRLARVTVHVSGMPPHVLELRSWEIHSIFAVDAWFGPLHPGPVHRLTDRKSVV